MIFRLKQILMAVLLAGSVAVGAQKVTLDTMLVDAQGNRSSLYENHKSGMGRGGHTTRKGEEGSITFYVEVAELLGAGKMEDRKKYKLDSFSLIGHPAGWWSGHGREICISNGENRLVRNLPESQDEVLTVHQKKAKKPFTFTSDDMLEVTIVARQDTDVHVEFFDAPPAPAVIRGTAMNMLPDGTLPSGKGSDNKYQKRWRFNCPAVRIRATQVEAKYDTKRLAMIGGGGLILLFLLKPLFGRKKKR